MFKLESDVRHWLQNGEREKLFWIEFASGGTVGMLDCMISHKGRMIPVECKKGEWKGNELAFSWRPGQKRVIKRLDALGVRSWVIVGEIGTEKLWIRSGISCVFGDDFWERVFGWCGMLKILERGFPL